MGVAESKFSPQIVTGSYIGWLEAIQGKTVGRYTERHLGGFTDEEALEAVHAYATAYQVPVTDATARYIAEVCNNDPFYIAAMISNQPAEKDLTTAEGVRDALALETITDKGEIALVWRTHFAEACARVDDVNARRIVLYLAGHEPAERDRAQIREDLDLTMTELKIEQCLHSLVMAGILAYGSSHFHFRGLGDKIFAMVLRSLCGEEIEQMKTKGFMANLSRQLIAAAAADSRHKDQATAKKKDLPAILRANPGATLHFDEESGCWDLIEFPKEPPPDNPDEEVAWLMRYVLASDSDTFENPEHGRYPEGILRAALECLDIGFEPDKSKWLTAPTREKFLNEN
ncbi:MAG: hypothetical protein GY842_28595 [bacterium]|nr:hypothetical protein [bacterium]